MNLKKIPEEKRQTVIELFYSQYDNTTPTIAEQTGLTVAVVNKIITQELKTKKNYTKVNL